MTRNSSTFMPWLLAYDYDSWHDFGARKGIFVDSSRNTNNHILLNGISGSGKSYALNLLFARLVLLEKGEYYFIDYKGDDQFSHLINCPRYFPYSKSLEAFEIVYEIMQNRMSGKDASRTPTTLIWDEYVAEILSLLAQDKKKAEKIMTKVSEILMLGRSLGIRLITSTQRADAVAFPLGSRMNYGAIIVIGSPPRATYEMFFSREQIDSIADRKFDVGEGVVLLQGKDFHFVKIPTASNMEKVHQVCIDALTK